MNKKKKLNFDLTSDEKQLEAEIERGDWKPVSKKKAEQLRSKMVKAANSKNKDALKINAGNFLDKIAFNGSSPNTGDYVKVQRKILNFTLDDLENVTGIDKANLSAYENNKKEIGVKVAVKLGAALNLDPNILIESSILAQLKSPEIKEIFSKSKKLSKIKSA